MNGFQDSTGYVVFLLNMMFCIRWSFMPNRGLDAIQARPVVHCRSGVRKASESLEEPQASFRFCTCSHSGRIVFLE
jgi:hypothetical protein